MSALATSSTQSSWKAAGQPSWPGTAPFPAAGSTTYSRDSRRADTRPWSRGPGGPTPHRIRRPAPRRVACAAPSAPCAGAQGRQARLAARRSRPVGWLEPVPAEVSLLRFCAFLSPEAIPLSLLQQSASALPPESEMVAAIEEGISLNRAVSALLDYSLTSRLGDRLTVHGPVQAVVRDSLSDAGRQL
jgi:hypothetical protein